MAITSANAKTRSIDIKSTLDSAKVIQTIRIFEYSDSLMFYGFVGSSDTLSISCMSRDSSELFRLEQINLGAMKESDFAGKWPAVSDTVV